jgi:hypothetical protein
MATAAAQVIGGGAGGKQGRSQAKEQTRAKHERQREPHHGQVQHHLIQTGHRDAIGYQREQSR